MCAFTDFNTSYVTVQQYSEIYANEGFFYFNTSYVTVQHLLILEGFFCEKISIHPMLRFNPKKQSLLFCFWNFNTSYVTVQLLCIQVKL